MEAIAILSIANLLVDYFENGPYAVAKGIIISAIPGSEVVDLVSATNYVFDLNGNYNGRISSSSYKKINLESSEITNFQEVTFALNRYDFPKLVKQKFETFNPPTFEDMDFPQFDSGEFPDYDS